MHSVYRFQFIMMLKYDRSQKLHKQIVAMKKYIEAHPQTNKKSRYVDHWIQNTKTIIHTIIPSKGLSKDYAVILSNLILKHPDYTIEQIVESLMSRHR